MGGRRRGHNGANATVSHQQWTVTLWLQRLQNASQPVCGIRSEFVHVTSDLAYLLQMFKVKASKIKVTVRRKGGGGKKLLNYQ